MEKNHQDGALGAEHVRQIGTHGVQRTEEEISYFFYKYEYTAKKNIFLLNNYNWETRFIQKIWESLQRKYCIVFCFFLYDYRF